MLYKNPIATKVALRNVSGRDHEQQTTALPGGLQQYVEKLACHGVALMTTDRLPTESRRLGGLGKVRKKTGSYQLVG
jgi:hypothetical protein